MSDNIKIPEEYRRGLPLSSEQWDAFEAEGGLTLDGLYMSTFGWLRVSYSHSADERAPNSRAIEQIGMKQCFEVGDSLVLYIFYWQRHENRYKPIKWIGFALDNGQYWMAPNYPEDGNKPEYKAVQYPTFEATALALKLFQFEEGP